MGGEKCEQITVEEQQGGSPPHGRGKDVHVLHAVADLGITPAWAGKSCAPLTGHITCRDHPRMGGEKVVLSSFPQIGRGSPPHGRGKAKPKPVKTPVPRITPAWAGKRLPPSIKPLWIPGSPPHGRGKGEGCPAERAEDRITPAWAGKSDIYETLGTDPKDHPRMGGEKPRSQR